MRLAFLTHEPFYPPSGGGSAEALYLVQEMAGRGHEVHVFCPSFPEPDEIGKRFAAGPGGQPGGAGLRFHLFTAWPMGRYTSLRNFKYLVYPFFLQRMVERASRRVGFDLVLSQHAIAAVAAGRLKRRLGLPVVMNFLDYLTGFLEAWPRYLAPRGFIRALERFELSLPQRHGVDGVMTVSDTLADYFAGAGYPRGRILPIYYGYDSARFPYAEAPGDGPAPVVVMHGSFDHHHLGAIALEALRLVARAKPHVRFRFVGRQTAALTKFRRRAEATSPGLRIECTGFVPYAEMARHLATATVGIVPYEESTGTHCAFVAKIVEYLGVGRPAVSTPLKSARRYFGDEPAVRFSEFDGESFARQVIGWLDEPLDLRLKLGRAASQRVQAALDWGAIARKAVDFVEKTRQQQGPA
jgi:glycosyltransferase involved in cell wall biosynthesis